MDKKPQIVNLSCPANHELPMCEAFGSSGSTDEVMVLHGGSDELVFQSGGSDGVDVVAGNL